MIQMHIIIQLKHLFFAHISSAVLGWEAVERGKKKAAKFQLKRMLVLNENIASPDCMPWAEIPRSVHTASVYVLQSSGIMG